MVTKKKPQVQLNVSLRGSLAGVYAAAMNKPGFQKAGELFLTGLFAIGNDPDLVREKEGDTMVVGLKSDIGKYPPDW